jgi:hypothetical protein
MRRCGTGCARPSARSGQGCRGGAKDAKLARLRKVNAELRLEQVSRFRFVEDHQRTVGVKRLCQVPRVSRPGFYAGEIDLLEAGLARRGLR